MKDKTEIKIELNGIRKGLEKIGKGNYLADELLFDFKKSLSLKRIFLDYMKEDEWKYIRKNIFSGSTKESESIWFLKGYVFCLENKVRRNYSKKGDISYDTSMTLAGEVINKRISKYKAVTNYYKKENIRSSESSIRNKFDSFLKTHKQEVMSKYNISEYKFLKYFFPNKLSQS